MAVRKGITLPKSHGGHLNGSPASCHWLLRSFPYFWCWPVEPDPEAGAAFRLLSLRVLMMCQRWQQPGTPHNISLLRERKGRQVSSSLPAPSAWASSSGVASEAPASSRPVQDKLQDMGNFCLLKKLAGCWLTNNHLTSPLPPCLPVNQKSWGKIPLETPISDITKWLYLMHLCFLLKLSMTETSLASLTGASVGTHSGTSPWKVSSDTGSTQGGPCSWLLVEPGTQLLSPGASSASAVTCYIQHSTCWKWGL